ncbi:MAG: hypothetical protein KDA63_06230 [Planctomycetales bacterium]|nr:hypothetical protein [Planctomycetales bacterium]
MFLALSLCATFLLAYYDALDKRVSPSAAVMCSLATSMSQMPGLVISLRKRIQRWAISSAVIVAVTANAAYAVYAAGGPEGSVVNAAQMHVIVFPMMHCLFAAFVYGGAFILSAVLSHSTGNR